MRRCEYCGCQSRFHSRLEVEEHLEEPVTKKLKTSFDSDKESSENLCENPGENRCQTETPEPQYLTTAGTTELSSCLEPGLLRMENTVYQIKCFDMHFFRVPKSPKLGIFLGLGLSSTFGPLGLEFDRCT